MPTVVKHAMSAHPMTVRQKDDLQNAFLRMKREKFRHMPVIDDDGKLIGILSERDCFRAMSTKEESSIRPGAKVGEYMSWPAISLSEDTSLESAVRTMLDNKISAIVVTREGALSGIITTEDMLRVLATLLHEPETRSQTLSFAYSSTLGKVADFLASAGI